MSLVIRSRCFIVQQHVPFGYSIWMCRPCIEILDEVMYYRWLERSDIGLCLLVTASLKERVLQGYHDINTAGHMGQKKTLDRLTQSVLWYHMAHDSEPYAKSCGICNQNKKPHVKPRAALKSFHAGFPMERVHLDILGPLTPAKVATFIL